MVCSISFQVILSGSVQLHGNFPPSVVEGICMDLSINILEQIALQMQAREIFLALLSTSIVQGT